MSSLNMRHVSWFVSVGSHNAGSSDGFSVCNHLYFSPTDRRAVKKYAVLFVPVKNTSMEIPMTAL